MIFSVNEQGVEALRAMASRMLAAVEEISTSTNQMRASSDGNQDTLGPHKASLDEALESIGETIRLATEPAEEIADTLNEIADDYEEIISTDRFRGGILGGIGAAIGGIAAGIFGGKGGSGGGSSSGGGATGGGSGGPSGGGAGGPSFDGMPTGKLENGMTVIKGDHYEQFLSDYYGESTFTSNRGAFVSETISPSMIEGVHLGDTEASDPGRFWGMHNSSKEFFIDTASHIPEVQAALDGGASLESVKNDPVLGTCASIYFDPQNMPRVEKHEGGYYTFDGDGRHRIIAARELGYDIPVRIVGVRSRKR